MKPGSVFQALHGAGKVYITSMNNAGVYLLGLLAVSFPSFSMAGDLQATQQTAYKTSIKQDELKTSTGKVRNELLTVLREMQMNGLLDTKPENIRKAAAELGVVGEEQMRSVVDNLKAASLNEDAQGQKQQIVDAYTTQKGITERLDDLSMQFQRAQARAELGKAAKNLLQRQMAVQRDTKALLAEKKPDAGKLQAAKAEQGALKSESENLIKKIKDAEKILPSEESAQLAQSRQIAEKAGLQDAADKANQNLSADQLAAAVKEQEKAKQALTQLVQSMTSQQPAMEQLQNAASELNKLIQEQKAVAQQAAGDAATPDNQAKQQQLADQTQMAKDQTGALNAQAASEMDRAKQQMESAAQNMAKSTDTVPSPDANAAAKQSQQAVENLEQAKQSLEKQISALAKEQGPKDFKEALADLNQLQNKTMQALVDQITAERTGADAAAQKAMADRLAKLQQETLPLSPPAAQGVGDAVQALSPSSEQGAAPKPSDSLQKALNALQAQIAQTKQDAAAAAALGQMNESLQAAQQSSQSADKSMQQTSPQSQQSAASQAQQAAGQAQSAASQAQQAGSKPAQQAAQAASEAFKQASQAAQQGDMKAAQAANQSGQQALAQAQQAAQQLGQQQSQELASMSGQSMPGTDDMPSQVFDGQVGPGGSAGPVPHGKGLPERAAQTVTGLNPKDREALTLFEQERTLPEFAPMVQQYRKNLANAVNP